VALHQSMGVVGALVGKAFVCGTRTTGVVTNFATGLSSVDFCGVSLAAVPTIDHSFATISTLGSTEGTVRVSNWKPTGTTNPTPTAITGPDAVAITWWAVGDR